jgi:H+-transporting ATPase
MRATTAEAEPKPAGPDYQALSVEEALRSLQSDGARGLSAASALERLERQGPNEIPEDKPDPLLRFARRFWGLTAWMLELTVLLALLRGRMLDAAIIGALLLLNGVLGYYQEQRASQAVEDLKQRLKIKVRTLRDGAWALVDAAGLVPGDIVRLRNGDFVPADLKLLSGRLLLDLSSMTGESEPVDAGAGKLLFSGSMARSGEATCLVLVTGRGTFFGKTIQLLQVASPKMHFEAVASRVVQWLLASVAVVLTLAALLWQAQGKDVLDILPLVLILLVSAIPVALPAMFTLTLTLGSMELTRRGVLVTRLSASEDAARMDVLCSDKTGTLTLNRLTVVELAPQPGLSPGELLRWGRACSKAENHDPIDLAFCGEGPVPVPDAAGWRQAEFAPFDPQTRRTEALIEHDGIRTRVAKGALESILALCPGADAALREAARAGAIGFARRGFRCLAVATQPEGGAYALAGLVALHDPLRADSKATVQALRELGVGVKMLTGDALPVAQEVARELGLGDRVRSYREATASGPLDMALVDGFAEIFPEDKFAIVKGLQDQGHVVGMTGDGVNDAPALKQAEVGVAVSDATDAAKSAASAVLTMSGLSALPDLIRVGRSIHQRMETWILNKVIKTFEIVFFVVAAFLVTGKFIVSTFDMVLMLFLVDFVTLSLATDHAKGQALPTRWGIDGLVKVALWLGLASVIESGGILWVGWARFGLGQDADKLHSLGFLILFYFGLFTVLAVRERGPFWTSRPSRTLAVALGLDALLVLVLVSVGVPGLAPLPLALTLLVVAYAFVFALVVNDRLKVGLLRRLAA